MIQAFLAFIRKGLYARYLTDIETKKDYDVFVTEQVQTEFDKLKDAFKNDKRAINLISKAEKVYRTERSYLTRRAEITEELAGVGLSVETASHDIMGIMGKVLANIDGLIQDLLSNDDINKEELLKELQSICGGMSFIEAQLKDIQLLFTSSKQRRKNIRVKDIVEKVERIYRRLLKKEAIDLSIRTVGSPLMAKTTDAVLLQLFLNLFDNSVYWLQQITIMDKKIEILLDGQRGQMIFADNGPGVNKEDIPYIFEPFYSGKGEEGRGLGLYIARQLLERSEYSINLIELKNDKLLPGANFVVNFIAEDKLMDIAELFKGVAVIIDDEIDNEKANIQKIIRQIEQKNIPYLTYDELPSDDVVSSLNNLSFLLLDWQLVKKDDLPEDVVIPATLLKSEVADNIAFLEEANRIMFLSSVHL